MEEGLWLDAFFFGLTYGVVEGYGDEFVIHCGLAVKVLVVMAADYCNPAGLCHGFEALMRFICPPDVGFHNKTRGGGLEI